MSESSVRIEINRNALKQLERDALKSMKEKDFEIQCPSCGASVLVSSGEGECSGCGQLFKVGDSV